MIEITRRLWDVLEIDGFPPSFIHSLNHSFSGYVLSAYYLLGAALHVGGRE